MSRNVTIGVAAAVLLGLIAGYLVGAGSLRLARQAELRGAPPVQSAVSHKVLYWKDPDGKADLAPAPKKTADGRDYLPVYDEEEPPLAAPEGRSKVKGKILYYRNPMGLPDTSPVPKKDWMGMDYIPVYEGEEPDAGMVRISLDRVQRAGVRSEAVALRVLARPVKAPGIAKLYERTLRSVSLRADGFIDKLIVNATGEDVKAGDPMFVVYSPQIVSVQIDYRSAVGSNDQARRQTGALQRLKNFGLPESVIEQIKLSPEPVMLITWPAPATGVVMRKNVIEGQMAKAGDELYLIAVEGAGSEVMRRIAVPMIGGMLSSTVLTLLVIPAIYGAVKGWGLPPISPRSGSLPTLPSRTSASPRMLEHRAHQLVEGGGILVGLRRARRCPGRLSAAIAPPDLNDDLGSGSCRRTAARRSLAKSASEGIGVGNGVGAECNPVEGLVLGTVTNAPLGRFTRITPTS